MSITVHPELVEALFQKKVKKNFDGGRQSKKVCLLQGSEVVAKHFDAANPKHVKAYEKEVRNLQNVEKCSFVPHLVAADGKRLILYTTYCGRRPERYTGTLKKEVKRKVKKLKEKYGLTRKFTNGPKEGLPRLANLAIHPKTKKVMLIDMGPPFKEVSANK